MALSIKNFFKKNQSDLKSLERGDIISIDGYAVMTQETLAYLLALADKRDNLKSLDDIG